MPQLNIMMYLSFLLLGGLFCGRMVKHIKLPNVTGYLLAGLLMGPCVLKIIPGEIIDSFDLISQMALAFIAFTIGLSFKASYFKRVGIAPVVIAVFEALAAVFFVQAVLILCGFEPAFSIVLGAIAAATAPAATIMVIKQYRAKGPLTDTLLSVVAIDDAVALVAFGFAITIAKGMGDTGQTNLLLSLAQPFLEVILALATGSVLGLLMILPLKHFKKQGNRLVILIAFVFLNSALASLFGVSELLTCMMAGAAFCNVSPESDRMADLADQITPPLFLMFFVVSGAGLDLTILPSIGVIGLIYVILRVAGKIAGAYLGARIMKAPSQVARYLGPTLIPQAGVAIGLTIVAQSVVPEYAGTIRAVVLCGTLIYELTGPVITKWALTKAGEIRNGA
ncbi:MAG: cation:proton antiporter [Lachnospiraceae bacterium]|jgi:Kef-type K+ transport system membrane component KefB|nr:cation:proton antiporter [Lachnospiraceae bacterium]